MLSDIFLIPGNKINTITTLRTCISWLQESQSGLNLKHSDSTPLQISPYAIIPEFLNHPHVTY